MKFAAAATLILAGSWSSAEPWEERSLQEAFGPDGYGRGPSYGGPSYKPFKPNGWIIQNFQGMPGSGFEVEEGHLVDFESVSTPPLPPPPNGHGGSHKGCPQPLRSNGHGGCEPPEDQDPGDQGLHGGSKSRSSIGNGGPPPTPEGICSENLCYNNVYAIVKGKPLYDSYKVVGESIKLCLVNSGDSCWTVTCPSAKMRPRVRYHGCYTHESSCYCNVDYVPPISYNTAQICVRTTSHPKCIPIVRGVEGDADVDGLGCCVTDWDLMELSPQHCTPQQTFEPDGITKKRANYCSVGSVATVEIECREPYYD